MSKEVPVGEPHIFWMLVLFFSIFSEHLFAGITALEISPSSDLRSGQEVVINPTIASVPSGTVQICWGLYYDAECTSAVEDFAFLRARSEGANAVRCTMPTTAGTYYIKSELKTGKTCAAPVDTEIVTPVAVYPSDADVVLTRDGQAAAEQLNLTSAGTKRAYGAMRFSKEELNDATESAYKRYNYFVSFPFDVQVADIYGIGTVGTHWRVFFYDGKGRAEEGYFAERTDNWTMIDDTDSVLHAGQGYLLQLNSLRMAEDRTDVWTNGADIATLFFPALTTFSDWETVNETIPALGETYHCTIDLSASLGAEGDRRVKDSYWRCIGVPSFGSPSGIAGPEYLYEWDTEDNSLSVVASDGYAFKPTHAYLVQHNGEIIWTDVTKPASIVARKAETAEQEWRLELHIGDALCDKTYIRATDEATAAFDFGHDLSKELNAGKANLYTLVGYERLAANCLPASDSLVVPVGVQIAQSGEYRFAAQGSGLWLTDQTTGTRTNLADSMYTVSLEAGTYDGRFYIETGERVSTGVGEVVTVSGERLEVSGVRKELREGRMYIVREGKMYDARGIFVQKAQK